MIIGAIIFLVGIAIGYFAPRSTQQVDNIKKEIKRLIKSQKATIIDMTPLDLGDEKENN